MESGNGIEEAEPVKDSTENAPEEANGSGKENEVTKNGATLVQANEASEDITVNAETLDPSGAGDEGSTAVTDSKAPNASKKAVSGGGNRLKKITKGRVGKPDEMETQKRRPVLSQSLSFPSKESGTTSLRTNTTSIRQPKVASKLANGDPSSKQHSTSASIFRRSLPVKTGFIDATGNGTSEVQQPNDAKWKLSRHSLPVKVDDDAQSNDSSSTSRARKSTGSGFNFRLDERAEKRKEFFMKLEEKIQAKEVEKTNLQEKSKENHEAEIKQLRKSLTFKATPIPSFYKEPGPPKVELKKIPPTRAKSPKLGRRKPSVPADENRFESGSPRLAPGSVKLKENPANDKGTHAASKNPIQKSLSKLPSLKSKATKTEAHAPTRKNSSLKSDKVKAGGNDSESTNFSAKQNAVIEPDSLENRVEEEDKSIDNDNEVGISPPEVPVQG